MSKPIKRVIDDANYWPGMGLVTGFLMLFLVGLAVNAFIVRRVLGLGEELLLRVPVVKTVYSAIRDMTRLVNTDKKKGDLDRVVRSTRVRQDDRFRDAGTCEHDRASAAARTSSPSIYR